MIVSCVFFSLAVFVLSMIQMVEWMKAIVHFKCNHIRLLPFHTARSFREVVKTTKMKPHNNHRTIYGIMCSFSRETSNNKKRTHSSSCITAFFLWLLQFFCDDWSFIADIPKIREMYTFLSQFTISFLWWCAFTHHHSSFLLLPALTHNYVQQHHHHHHHQLLSAVLYSVCIEFL